MSEQNKVVGKSLSFCVICIANGLVNYDDVIKIDTNTRCRNEEDFEEVIYNYTSTYWSKFPETASEIAKRLWSEGKIYQPRLVNPEHTHASEPRWIKEPLFFVDGVGVFTFSQMLESNAHDEDVCAWLNLAEINDIWHGLLYVKRIS